jgi:hypothetical protein
VVTVGTLFLLALVLDKGKVVAMLLASLDDAFTLSDEEIISPQAMDNSSVDPIPPTLDNIHIVTHTEQPTSSSPSVHDSVHDTN